MFYEEVPGRPAFLLRALLPYPVRTEGDKTRVGATVRCAYREGDLAKRITTVEPPHLLQFEVIEQRLGIEGCILTLGGSYQIYAVGDATDVVLITNYRAYLRPRYLWRPLEALLVSQLHVHILRGVRAAVLPRNPAVRPAVAESLHATVRPSRRLLPAQYRNRVPAVSHHPRQCRGRLAVRGAMVQDPRPRAIASRGGDGGAAAGPAVRIAFPQGARYRGGRARRVGDGRNCSGPCVRSCRRPCSSCSMRTDSCGRAASSTSPPAWWSRTSPSSCWSGCAVPFPEDGCEVGNRVAGGAPRFVDGPHRLLFGQHVRRRRD